MAGSSATSIVPARRLRGAQEHTLCWDLSILETFIVRLERKPHHSEMLQQIAYTPTGFPVVV